MFHCDLSIFKRVIREKTRYVPSPFLQVRGLTSVSARVKHRAKPCLITQSDRGFAQVKSYVKSYEQKFNTTGNLSSPLGPGYPRLPAGSRQPARGRTTATNSTNVPLIPAAAG